MTALGTFIGELKFPDDMNRLSNLFKRPQLEMTIWDKICGRKNVRVAPLMGSVKLDDLADKIREMSNQCLEGANWSTDQRIAGMTIVDKLMDLYQTADEIGNSNFLYRIFTCIRNALNTVLTFFNIRRARTDDSPRDWFEEFGSRDFRAFTPDDYRVIFSKIDYYKDDVNTKGGSEQGCCITRI